jgi:DNA-binding transcriptional ArsR family regulator
MDPSPAPACYVEARAYLALGLHPIPADGKRPLVAWKPYQIEAPLADECDEWWRQWPTANVGLVLGRGLFVVDLDGEGAEGLLHNANIALPKDAPRVRTGNGYHVYLSADDAVPDRIALLTAPGGGKPQVDIRGIGFVVAPPSIHPSGRAYEWVTPFRWPVPKAPEALLRLIQAPRTGPATVLAGPNWVAEALRGVGEGQRDDMCTRLAGYFIGKGLDRETTASILTETFGRQCTPPFPAADVWKCVRSVATRHRPSGEPSPSVAWVEPVTLPELFRAPPPEPCWLVDQVLLERANGWLGAGAKIGKSYLALDLLLCLALGQKWLGHFTVPRPLHVLLIEEEDSAWRVYSRLLRLSRGYGLHDLPVGFHLSIRRGWRLDDESIIDALTQWCRERPLDLIAWDVFNRLHHRDERKPDQIMPVLWRLDQIRNELGVSNLLAHHARKPTASGPDLAQGGQRLRGPSEFWGWAENSLYLTPLKAKGHVIIEPESKDAVIEPFKAHLEDLPDGARRWIYDGVVPAATERGEQTRRRILAALEKPATVETVADLIKLSVRSVKDHLGTLRNDGVVDYVKEPGRAGRKLWFRVGASMATVDGVNNATV